MSQPSYRQLGSTGLECHPLGFGCYAMGAAPEGPPDSLGILARFER